MIARLGGHSVPRTHRGKEKCPGMTITSALMNKSQKDAKTTRIVTEANVTKILMKDGVAAGVEYEKDGKKFQEFGKAVIISTGGYGADVGEGSLL